MCGPIAAALISVAATMVGSFMTAKVAADNAKMQAAITKQQNQIEMEQEKIKSISESNTRWEEYMRSEATNRAALSAAGVGRNISYWAAIAPKNKEVASRDVANIQYDSAARSNKLAYNIKVAKAEAGATARGAWATAASDTIGSFAGVAKAAFV